LTTSHVAAGTLRLYNYKIVDFLLYHFKENWFDKDDETKWRMVNDLEWKDIVSYYGM